MADTTAAGVPAASGAAGRSRFLQVGDALKRGDLALAVGVMTILVVLILPMPPLMLDMALAISITFAVLILMTSLFIKSALEFSSFPTILLIATMLRLSLNLASTRLILQNGHEGSAAAGHVIEAFGNFVMRGNFVIGLIVFAILIIVNFVVITKGSGRIAEVAARFSLDSMPGKQMAIDADLSAGLIDETTARTRRKALEDETGFFGAMDGASKFVRGDAIAGLLITFINVIGGIIVGVAQMGLSFGEAAQTYTLLTVGDGLVSQIPALIVSTAAGLLVSKAGSDESADQALGRQFTSYPQALGMSSAVMAIMSLLPGIPMVPFLALSGGAGYLAWRARNKQVERKTQEIVTQAEAKHQAEQKPAEEPISSALAMDELKIEIGYALLPLVNGADGQDRLTEQIKALRRQLASEMGFVMPSVRLLDNMHLEPNSYVVKVKEVESGRGHVYPNAFMVMDPEGRQIDLPGTHTTEPTFGLPATWIEASLRDEANIRGLTVVDPATVVATHLTELLKANMSELLSYAEVSKLLSELPKEQQKLVDDVVPGAITISGIQRVLQTLLEERVSIRDLPTILEAIAEVAGSIRSTRGISEHVRARLSRQLCAQHQSPGGYVPIVALSPDWEREFAEALVGDGEDRQLAIAPSKLQQFIKSVRDRFEEAARQGEMPVLLTSGLVRPHVRSIVERFRAQTVVMSQNEIHPRAKLKTLGSI
ncbi:flagellar biosynthesis protein FlhA [Lutibaculum baratangense]|uniref:Flagellar biosynthesis protein FlhA n=1 Tax=Lutibaculum baratangense AMV1 TaxID=631454 RepID=V4T7U4_9HYPH|nr:flagellar biosynthesis protein FlhA [Lutibaculum baratangense]ESR22678.1 Flagellar biosynthesis protein FlhA [Lutibaculum baratangense AMV1]